MARQPRFFASGQPLHVIQRGNNHAPIFHCNRDYRVFLDYLTEACSLHGVSVHAYVLMTNHWHLLATPQDANSLPKALQSVGRRYVQRFNLAYERSGTLWEGRYRASLIDSTDYLFTCMRYIELNPVRAGMTRRAEDYLWSSHRANGYGASDLLVTPHELYEGIAPTPPERQSTYRDFFGVPLVDADVNAIRDATNKNWALGDDGFRKQIEGAAGRRAAPIKKGRRKNNGLENRV